MAVPVNAGADYDRAAIKAASAVIGHYSTSFSMAVRLLHGVVRERVRTVYALVRVADEIVDGAAADHGLDVSAIAAALDEYERATTTAMTTGFSTDLVIHAFAQTARATGIGTDLTEPFFASMRMDLGISTHDATSLQEYVYGSAEVVGLMCLRIFTTDQHPHPLPPDPGLVHGARCLGSAFQKVNFLRDLGADHAQRGRTYFPGIDPVQFTDAERDLLLADIEADLDAAAAVISRLPRSSRAAVQAAHDLFAELTRRLHETPAATLRTTRIRVSNPRKVAVLARSLGASWRPAPLIRQQGDPQ